MKGRGSIDLGTDDPSSSSFHLQEKEGRNNKRGKGGFFGLQRSSTDFFAFIPGRNYGNIASTSNDDFIRRKDLEDELNQVSNSFQQQLQLSLKGSSETDGSKMNSNGNNNPPTMKTGKSRKSFGQRLQKSSSNVFRAATSSIHSVPSCKSFFLSTYFFPSFPHPHSLVFHIFRRRPFLLTGKTHKGPVEGESKHRRHRVASFRQSILQNFKEL